MDYKLELIAVPVSDVDRAKAFYVDQAGFNADHDHKVSDDIRFVQLTPPGSACSIAIGKGVSEAEPGSVQGLSSLGNVLFAQGRAEEAEHEYRQASASGEPIPSGEALLRVAHALVSRAR